MIHKDTLKDTVFSALQHVAKPSRYAGGELNMIRKSPGSGNVSVCLAFPDIYDIGQSYIGFHILYHVLNNRPGTVCERTFAPWPDMEEIMRSRGITLWSLENFLPVSSFDVVGFTLQYELHYTSVLNMLDLAGIPLRADKRGEGYPLIIGGGTCVVNPEPVAAFFDAFLLGDGEEGFPEMLDVIERCKRDGLGRTETLKRLAAVEGVYIPGFYREARGADGSFLGMEPLAPEAPLPVRSRVVRELRPEHYPDRPLVPLCEVVHDRLAVEIMRGCTRGCRFCSAGMSYRPKRIRPSGEIVDSIVRGIQSTGWDEVSLVSLSTTDHPGLEEIVGQIGKKLPNKAVSISLSSLRADNFSLKMAEATAGGRKTGLTFAVEAGTQRLRDVINKNLTEEQLFETVKESLEHGFKSIKLYFMVGLPTETDEDLLATADLLTRIGRLAKQYNGRSINVTISPFSPKPGTPFQWEPQDSAAELKRKTALIASSVRSRAVNLREGDPGLSVLECRIARGGRNLASVIHDAWKRGSRLDGWSEMFNGVLWNEAFRAVGVELSDGDGAVKPGAPLPWGHLHFGVDERYLLAERERSLNGVSTPDCTEACGNCGPYAALCRALKKNAGEEQASADSASDGARKAHTDMYGRKRKQVVRNNAVPLLGTRLRIRYTKEGTIRFVGHLDMVRIFDRIMRRAGIPIAYSQGFHPHPKLSFGHPLPLGLTSRAEYADITLSEPFPEFEKMLRNNLPDGLGLVRIAVIPDRASSLTQIVTVSDYFVRCEVDDETERRLKDILGRESIPVIRSTKRGDKEVDLRPGIEELIVAGDRSGFTMRLSVEAGAAVKPSEVLGLVFPGNHPSDVERTEQYAMQNNLRLSPFDVMW